MQRHEGGDRAAIHLPLRLLGGVLLLAHLVLVGWLTLRPLDVPWAAAANLAPLEGIRTDLAHGPLEAAHRIGGSLLLLAPLGVLLPLVSGRLAPSPLGAWASLVRTTTAGALVSTVVEMLQTAVPGQVVDVDHVLLNTVGVMLAHLAVVPALRSRLRRARAVRDLKESKEFTETHSQRTALRDISSLRELAPLAPLAPLAQRSRGASQRASQGTTPRIPGVGLGLRTDVLSAIHREY
ncbi:VanZ family protein [Streptomyces bambusae]|uniref:VanZ family protein n=1 Tax=Streptomyces bambusae TaxID=1550616 RepID=UPI0035AC02E4